MTIKTLIVTGGHNFEREAFFAMFNSFANINYTQLAQPEANQQLTSSFYEAFEVIVFYDMMQEITPPQQAALRALLERGKGIVFLHHALASYRTWAEYENITGGRFYLDLKPDVEDRTNYPEDKTGYPISTYAHNVEIPVKIVDKQHPITSGLDDFILRDEIYGHIKVLPAVRPLLSTTHPESGEVIGWTHRYGKSPIVYLQPGHNHSAYNNPNYRRLVEQAITWVSGNVKSNDSTNRFQ